MKFVSTICLIFASVSAVKLEDPHYKDVKNEELKCRANRNRTWEYDATENNWFCKQNDPLDLPETSGILPQ